MDMDTTTILGLVAAGLTTVAFFPQAVKSWRTRSTGDISFAMISILVVGIGLWLVYGIMLRDIPLIAANTITFALASSILYVKLRHG
jgi:MtN3 and saliva related transmembrane protein